MKKNLLTTVALVLTIILTSGNAAGGWFVGEAPKLACDDEDLQAMAEAVCKGDMLRTLENMALKFMGTSREYEYRELIYAIRTKKAIWVTNTKYILKEFRATEKEEIKGWWPFVISCNCQVENSKGISFSKRFDVTCGIGVYEVDNKQYFDIPEGLFEYVDW